MIDPGEPPDVTIEKDLANAAALPAKKADDARGYSFEAKAIAENMKKRQIETTSKKLRCKICGAEQELDVVFKDGQIAECSSKKGENVRTRETRSSQTREGHSTGDEQTVGERP